MGVELFAPAHQGARGGAQGFLDLAGTGVAVCHQGGEGQTVACGVIGGVREVVVGSEKLGDLPALGKATDDGIDSDCPLGQSG